MNAISRLFRKNQSILLLVAIVVALYMFIKGGVTSFKNLFKGALNFGQVTEDTDMKIIEEMKKDVKVTSLMTPGMYDRARRINSAINGIGTDEKEIYAVFAELQSSAAVRALNCCHDELFGSIFLGLLRASMVERLRDDLSADEFKVIEPKLKLGGLV